jgi:hypothetical protein
VFGRLTNLVQEKGTGRFPSQSSHEDPFLVVIQPGWGSPEVKGDLSLLATFQPPEYLGRACKYPSTGTTGMLSLKLVVSHFAKGPWNETMKVQSEPHGDVEAITSPEIRTPLLVARTGCFASLMQR